jgi:hypothetical protein
MKTTMKILVGAAMIGAASLSANAGVRIGFSIGLPLVVAAPVCVAPAPVEVAPACPPPVYSTAYVVQPACPGPNYAWVAGYWSANNYGRVWVPGAWRYQPRTVVVAQVGFGYGHGHDRDGWYRHDDGDRGHDRGGNDRGHGDYHR